MTLRDLEGTRWSGEGELWLDPLGNEAFRSPCAIRIERGAVAYEWSHEGRPQSGRLAPRPGGADFTDTFHSAEPMTFTDVPNPRALVDVAGTYSGGGETWGWRIALALRPSGELVLQMTNIAPWGEEGRAVRMVARR